MIENNSKTNPNKLEKKLDAVFFFTQDPVMGKISLNLKYQLQVLKRGKWLN